MTSEPIRDPITDSLLTPENSALIVIDYQPTQVGSVRSMDHDALVKSIVRVARTAVSYKLPIVLSTVNVMTGKNAPTIDPLRSELAGAEELDRTTINAWEDVAFKRAVEATGRRKLVMAALWTEACLSFPTLDAIREGYEVYPVVDAVGGTSVEAHRAALDRLDQAGAQQTSVTQLLCELQRDWARSETVPEFVDILFGEPAHAVSRGAL
jgi:nicotinamidase-related amidase